jgi:hypothetical protein
MQNAMREFEKIIVEHPRYREYQRLLSEAELVWAEHLIDTGEFEEASKYLDHSESVLRDGIERYDLIPWRSQMVDLKAVRSEWYAAQNSHASAIEEIRIAIQKQMSVMSSVPRSKYEDIRLSRLQAKLAKLTAKTLDDE